MKSSPEREKFVLAPPTKIGNKGKNISKMGTWFSYRLNVYKKPLIILIALALSGTALYQGSSYMYTSYKEGQAQRIEAKAAAEKLAIQKHIESLREQFQTQSILTPMTEKDIDDVLEFARASYLDSVKDLSRAFFSMEYVASEGKYEVVFETTQREMTDIVNEMNVEYGKVLQFMNTFKNSVRTYESALQAGNKTVLDLTEKQMQSDMKIYANWFQRKVSGELRKTERLKERADRHVKSIVSLDGLNKFLQTKSAQIDNLEPFTALVIKK